MCDNVNRPWQRTGIQLVVYNNYIYTSVTLDTLSLSTLLFYSHHQNFL
jgi:hypothetical protein